MIDPDGTMRRLATRAHGPDRAEIEAWIMGRALDRSAASPTTRVLEGEGGRVAELTGELREAMIHDEEDRRHMDASGLRSTIALPLAPSGGPLGALGMAVGRSGRRTATTSSRSPGCSSDARDWRSPTPSSCTA